MLGTISTDDKITLEQWYYSWLFDYRIKDMKPKTFEKYEGIYRNYIKNSEIGRIKLKDLRAIHLQKYYNNLLSIKPVSTVKSLNTRIKPCLTEAEKQGYIQKNWCKLVTLPKVDSKKEVEILTRDQQIDFIKAINGTKHEVMLLFALSTGVRLGELLALKWSDIDFSAELVNISRSIQRHKNPNTGKYELKEQTPKTMSSIRSIPIPGNVIVKLKEHKKKQNKHILSLGEAYHNNNYIFCNAIGDPLDEKTPGRSLDSILRKINIDHIKFHALRHTYITRLFELGVPAKTISELAGHSDIQTTMNIYTHVDDKSKIEAVNKLNDIFII